MSSPGETLSPKRAASLVASMRTQIESLRTENRELRERLSRYEPKYASAPTTHLKESSKRSWRYAPVRKLSDGISDVDSDCLWRPGFAVTSCVNATATGWDIESQSALYLFGGHNGAVNSCRLHPRQPLLCTASGDGAIRVFRVPQEGTQESRTSVSTSGSEMLTRGAMDIYSSPSAHGVSPSLAPVSPVGVGRRGRRCSGDDGGIFPMTIDDVEELTETSADIDKTTAAAMTPTSSSPKPLIIPASITIESAFPSPMSAADWMEHGDMVACGGWTSSVKVFDLESGTEVYTLDGHRGSISDVTVHSKKNIIVSSSLDGTFRLWDIRSPALKVAVVEGHSRSVNSALYSLSNDYMLASGGDDKQALLWDSRRLDKPILSLSADSGVNRLAFCRGSFGNGPIGGTPSSELIALPTDKGEVVVYDTQGLQHARLVSVSSDSSTSSAMMTSCAWYQRDILSVGWGMQLTSWVAV